MYVGHHLGISIILCTFNWQCWVYHSICPIMFSPVPCACAWCNNNNGDEGKKMNPLHPHPHAHTCVHTHTHTLAHKHNHTRTHKHHRCMHIQSPKARRQGFNKRAMRTIIQCVVLCKYTSSRIAEKGWSSECMGFAYLLLIRNEGVASKPTELRHFVLTIWAHWWKMRPPDPFGNLWSIGALWNTSYKIK